MFLSMYMTKPNVYREFSSLLTPKTPKPPFPSLHIVVSLACIKCEM